MSKIWVTIGLFLAFVFGGLYAGLGDAPSTLQDGNVDVKKPSFLTILLRKPHIYDDISEEEDVTIFAPSDAAFGKLNPDILDNIMKPENEPQLKRIMDAHVVKGEYYTKDLKDGMKLTTQEGKELNFTVEDGKVKVNGADFVESDGMTQRGVMHVINRVLIPHDMTMKDLKQ